MLSTSGFFKGSIKLGSLFLSVLSVIEMLPLLSLNSQQIQSVQVLTEMVNCYLLMWI